MSSFSLQSLPIEKKFRIHYNETETTDHGIF